MSTNTRLVETTPERVWEVLSDGWLYPLWVVGASRMRDVDSHWPQVGAKLHHSVGVWPALIDDSTSVIEADPGRRIKLHARGWPAGAAEVVITLSPQGAGTLVTIEEEPVSGPATLIPQPVRGMSLRWRNSESLRRLAFIAERREPDAARRPGDEGDARRHEVGSSRRSAMNARRRSDSELR
ncbi:MAG: SRPBCC family protein, partial [Proteobacteria bacterium]